MAEKVEPWTVHPRGTADRHSRPYAGSTPAPCTTGFAARSIPPLFAGGVASLGRSVARPVRQLAFWIGAREPTAALHRHQHANADVIRQDIPGRYGNGAPTTTYGISSRGRAAVSKSAGCRFEACVPSQYNGVSRAVVTTSIGKRSRADGVSIILSPRAGASCYSRRAKAPYITCRRSSDGKSIRVPARRGRRFKSGRLPFGISHKNNRGGQQNGTQRKEPRHHRDL